MAVLTAGSTFSGSVPTELYRRKALDTIQKSLVAFELGMIVPFPKNEGKTVKFFIYDRVANNTTALTEGVVPTEGSLTVTGFTKDLSQYGDYVKLSDWSSDVTISPAMKHAVELLSQQAKETIDKLILNELDTGLANQFANSESALTGVGSSDVMTAKELLKAFVTLDGDDVPKFDGEIYKGIIHPLQRGDIFNDTNVGSLNDMVKYASSENLKKNMLPIIYGVEVRSSSNISSTTSGTEDSDTVYSSPVVGKNAFGVVDIEGRKNNRNFVMKVKQHGSSGVADPLDQIASVGWKLNGFAVKYLGGQGTNADLGVKIRAGSQYS